MAQFAEHAFEVGDLLFEELANVDARRCSCPPQCHDMGDFSEGQTKPACTSHEGQQAKDIRGVGAIAGRRAVGCREDSSRLVQPEGLAAQSAPGRDLANE